MFDLIGKRIKALVDHPDEGRVSRNEIGIIVNSDNSNYIVNFQSQTYYRILKPLDEQIERYQQRIDKITK